MARSLKKGPYVEQSLILKIRKYRLGGIKRPIKTNSRRSMIIPEFIGQQFLVHDGKKYIPVNPTPEMVNLRFGMFAPTRTFHGHSGDKKTKPAKPKK